jgi:8-oxo-dGTP pyrophosphatase MutT (NUDIX family)
MNQVPAWFYHQSAVIPYRLRNDGPEVLLITSRRQKRWVIPKGVIEPALSPAASAVQEAWEEAGLAGLVSPEPVGRYSYQKWGGTCHVEVFLLRVEKVLDDWPEAPFRQRRWLPPAAAADLVEEQKLKQLIIALPDILADFANRPSSSVQ